jgi:hypothetical protein
MSRSLASVLKTDSLKPLAQILRSKGRKGDTILAHISPKEAARLKREGGSGTINPDTGLPEFFDEYGIDFSPSVAPTMSYSSPDLYGGYEGSQAGPSSYVAPEQYAQTPVLVAETPYQTSQAEMATGQVPSYGYLQTMGQSGAYDPTLAGSRSDTGYDPYVALREGLASQQQMTGFQPSYSDRSPQDLQAQIQAAAGGVGGGADIPRPPGDIPAAEGEKKAGEAGEAGKAEDKGFLDKLLSAKNLPLLALGGGGALLSAYRSQQAQSQAAKAAEQIKAAYAAAAAEQRAGAQPLLQAGGTALSQALQGTLTPANQQAMQAAQAKAAQAASQTGGVGAVQTAISEADLRQRLLANQQSMALNLLGPANAQLSAAIQSELSGTTQGISTRLNMAQQANQAAAGVYQSLATIMAAGLK